VAQQPTEDKKQIGLTVTGQAALQVLMADGRFATEYDAYRFCISYAIAANLKLDDAPQGGYGTKFNASGGVDIGSGIRDLLDVLSIGDPNRPYATAEKLAEMGVTEVARRLEGSENLADIMSDVAG
jgi:hypothetical protein